MRNHSILLLYKRGGKTGGCSIVIFYTKFTIQHSLGNNFPPRFVQKSKINGKFISQQIKLLED